MATQWDGDIPIYVQLYQQVIRRILDDHLLEGEALPSVRKVASEYQLNPVTVSKAYQMLQEEEIVEKQRGKGLFIKEGVKKVILARERINFLEKEWPVVLDQIARLNLSAEDLLADRQGGK
ncbi:GntR family transcriptional regulator [Glaciecola sp. MH2013]|uniref:GntR family transcriptional regulator n=1 Tax=Glaciecola sp. MH2013 TaxID=2785524 RepID=UPI00189E5F4E|nr:GntR family transcriptional regulator [Glaciecola sp. MH2013]MBF7074269.1 GntR family transcriptional regulator [Glaciecola sp. MH2013]